MKRTVDTSVVIPARNAACALAACLASVNRLDPAPLEVIVVDDASSDETATIAERAGARVLRLAANKGPGLARNAGVHVARGSTIAFTDADCQVPEDWLAVFHRELDPGRYSGITGPYAGASVPTLLADLMDRALKHEQRAIPDTLASSISANLFVRASDFRAVHGFPGYRLAGAAMCCFGNEDEELAHLLVRRTRRPLRWLRASGVRHAFRPTWGAYFAQQSKYAEAIVLSYARFPSMLFATTNYSRSGGARKLAAFWLAVPSCAAAAVAGPVALLGAVPFVVVNAGAVRRAVEEEPLSIRAFELALLAYPFQAITALAWTRGLAVGGAKALFAALSLGFRAAPAEGTA